MSESAEVLVLIQGYWLKGRIPTRGSRVSDLLANQDTAFVTVEQASIAGDAPGGRELLQVPQMVLAKRRIAAIVMIDAVHEASTSHRMFATRETRQHEAVAIANGWIFQGFCHRSESGLGVQVDTILNQDGFFPMTRVVLTHSRGGQVSFPVALVNRAHVSGFSLHGNVGDAHNEPQQQPSIRELISDRALREILARQDQPITATAGAFTNQQLSSGSDRSETSSRAE